MLKQLLASASTIALLLVSSSNAGATASSASDRVTSPASGSEKSTINNAGKPASHHHSNYSSRTKACKSIPIPRPSVGGTRERIEAIRWCNTARSQE